MLVRGLTLSALLVSILGCSEKLPDRDYIPILKDRVYRVQEAVKSRGKNAIDSLLTESYADDGGADSLVQFVYGTDPTFEFERFAKTEILFTNDLARVDCLISGKDGRTLGAATLTFERSKDRWLLKRISQGARPVDSLQADSVL